MKVLEQKGISAFVSYTDESGEEVQLFSSDDSLVYGEEEEDDIMYIFIKSKTNPKKSVKIKMIYDCELDKDK